MSMGMTYLVASHVAGLDQAERVEHAKRRENADVALGEHLHSGGA